ncbi:MAG: ATP phosphoribosyltransferase regulatory subunit [Synergistaceae bacterium]|jgi:ATP phosphoribosyltransferase regulatory subunit|nr:ATP phosphoribosyltransferase regulatory subunit [Synergistaceae bacterium]
MDITPRGCSSIGGELAQGMEECRATAMAMFTSYGYSPFNPAELQLLEGMMKNLHRRRRGRVIALNSPFGEPCCLRADLTLSALSYMALHHAPDDFPLRLCYSERVFATPRPPRENIEDTQVGVELLGWEGIGSDVEVLAVLLSALDSLGLTESVVVLGDVSLFPALFADLPQGLALKLVELLEDGAYYEYGKTLASSDASERHKKILAELPWLKGPNEILSRAADVFGSSCLLEPLREITGSLIARGYGDRVRVDLGFIRDLGYYSGPVFNVYSSGDGSLLGGGGRYAASLADTRFSCQALGFGVSLRELALSRGARPASPRVMIWAGQTAPHRALAYAASLAEAKSPFEISWNPNDSESKDFAIKRGCAWWVNIEGDYALELPSGRPVAIPMTGGAR